MGFLFVPEFIPSIQSGIKTNTRRLAEGRVAQHSLGRIVAVRSYDGRLIWAVGRSYAVQQGRGKRASCRVRILSIRQEHLQGISEADIAKEGVVRGLPLPGGASFGWDMPYGPGSHAFVNENWVGEGHGKIPETSVVAAGPWSVFAALWDHLNKPRGTTWYDNPLVFAIEFQRLP